MLPELYFGIGQYLLAASVVITRQPQGDTLPMLWAKKINHRAFIFVLPCNIEAMWSTKSGRYDRTLNVAEVVA